MRAKYDAAVAEAEAAELLYRPTLAPDQSLVDRRRRKAEFDAATSRFQKAAAEYRQWARDASSWEPRDRPEEFGLGWVGKFWTGQQGYVPVFTAIQVVDPGNALVEYGGQTYWVETATAGMTENGRYTLDGLAEGLGVKTYTSVLLANRAVKSLRIYSGSAGRSVEGPDVPALPPRKELPPEPPPPDPFPSAGWASEWKKVGDVRLRVAGVAVRKVPIRTGGGRDTDSAAEHLVVWVEVANDSPAKPAEVRWWQTSLKDFCVLTDASARPVPKSRIDNGASLRGSGSDVQRVKPGEPPARQVLLFTPVKPAAAPITLTLDAARVGESGQVVFAIPATALTR